MDALNDKISKRLKNILKSPMLIKFIKDNPFMTENLYRQILLLEELNSFHEKEKFIEDFKEKGVTFDQENWKTDFDEEEIEAEVDFFYKAIKDYAKVDLDNLKILEKPKVIENSEIPQNNSQRIFNYNQEKTTIDTVNDLKKDFDNIKKTYLFKTKPSYMPLWNKLLISIFLISGFVFCLTTIILGMLGQVMDITIRVPDQLNPQQWVVVSNYFKPGALSEDGYLMMLFRIMIFWFFLKISLDSIKLMKENDNAKYGADSRILLSLLITGLFLLLYDGVYRFKSNVRIEDDLFKNIINLNNSTLKTYLSTGKILAILSMSTGSTILFIVLITYFIKPHIDLNKVIEMNMLMQQKREQMMMDNFNKMKDSQNNKKYYEKDKEKTAED